MTVPQPNQLSYSSLTALLEHYRALRAAPSRSTDDERTLAALGALLDVLEPAERAALEPGAAQSSDSAARRHRERAETRLRRMLAQRGVIRA
jgi:hypothetical protein